MNRNFPVQMIITMEDRHGNQFELSQTFKYEDDITDDEYELYLEWKKDTTQKIPKWLNDRIEEGDDEYNLLYESQIGEYKTR